MYALVFYIFYLNILLFQAIHFYSKIQTRQFVNADQKILFEKKIVSPTFITIKCLKCIADFNVNLILDRAAKNYFQKYLRTKKNI